MKTKQTKNDLVKSIFFDATIGKRSKDNFVDGMWLIETIADNNYAWAIRDWANELREGRRDAESILRAMVDQTYLNTFNSKGATVTSMRVRNVYTRYFA